MTRPEEIITRDELLDWVDLILAVSHDGMAVKAYNNVVLIMDHLIEAELRLYGDKEDE